MTQVPVYFDGVEVREIPGTPRYFASADGRIVGPGGHWMKPNSDKRGYCGFEAYVDKRPVRRSWHRSIAAAWLGPVPPGMHVAHGNGDPSDNSLSNLRFATPSENILDKRLHGTCANANKTHCPYGHEYSDENTYIHGKNQRGCRECGRERSRLDYAAKKKGV